MANRNEESLERIIDTLLDRIERHIRFQQSRLLFPDPLAKMDREQGVVLFEQLGDFLKRWARETQGRILVCFHLIPSWEDYLAILERNRGRRQTQVDPGRQGRFNRAVGAFWDNLDVVIPALQPNKVYQEGMFCLVGYPRVTALILEYSPTRNSQLLLSLAEQRIEEERIEVIGTESLSLLVEALWMQEDVSDFDKWTQLQGQWDAFPGQCIDKTLHQGQVGVLLRTTPGRITFPPELGIWTIDIPSVFNPSVLDGRRRGRREIRGREHRVPF